MSNEINSTNTEQPTTPTPEADGGQGRTFTQEEVNRIVSERLAREREKLTQQPQEDEREKALREREVALEARESKAACQDYLAGLDIIDRAKPVFLEVLDTTDVEKFKTLVEKLSDGIGLRVKVETVGLKTCNPPRNGGRADMLIADAFKPKF